MTVFWKAVLVFSAGLLAAAESYRKPQPISPICSGFSEEQDHRDPPLTWRFRSCTTVDSKREVQTQFSNRSDKSVAFEFRLWTHPPKTCKTDEAPAAQGIRVLGANETEGWPYTVSTLNEGEEFTGRIWVCVREVGK